MKNFIQKIKNIYHHEELRNKILFTLGLILIYRVGSFIILPGVDSVALEKANTAAASGGLLDFLSMFTGGAFAKASIFALGIMPYISASIIIQLLSLAVPSIQKMQREGESGRKKITQWTRFLTIGVCLFQAPGYVATYITPEARPAGSLWFAAAVIILTCSTLFVMWLGEKITDRGIGNGTSLIIMIGILADLPSAFVGEALAQNAFFMIIEVAIVTLIVGLCVAIIQAIRRIPVQMAKMNMGSTHLPTGSGARSYIPIRLNTAGVMPIIFAQAIMFLPALIQQSESFAESTFLQSLADYYGWMHNLLFFLLIIVFTYFYTAITTNPMQMADDLKRNGNFIPGVKPGKPTADFIDDVLSKITLPGGIMLGLIAITPFLLNMVGLVETPAFGRFFGGSSLLISVGVLLDLLQQIESHLLSHHYDGLMKSGRVKGRMSQATPVGS